MEEIIVHEDQFYDINAPEYKLQLEFFSEKKEATFVVVKYLNKNTDERIEEIHLDNKQLKQLSEKLNLFLKK